MIDFAWPWLLLVVPLPWLARRVLPPFRRRREAALRVSFLDDFRLLPSAGADGPRRGGAYWLAWAGWALLVAAAARPQWLGEAIEIPVSGRDLLLAVDLSASMQQADFQLHGRSVDRLTASKAVVTEFIDRRVGDRIGLILFGRQAYLQAPLTFDRETVKTLLAEAVIGLAGKETAIGDAIGLAVKRLRESKADEQVLILVTDGASTAGEIEPLKAAELAAAEGLTIHTIGIGADEMLIRRLFGTYRVNPSIDLDEDTLRAIAKQTGGRYFRARDTQELAGIYKVIDAIEPVEKDNQYYRPHTELYPWPLAVALCVAAWLCWPATGGRAVVPWRGLRAT
jgi:Ca-activated chloride channel family protein